MGDFGPRCDDLQAVDADTDMERQVASLVGDDTDATHSERAGKGVAIPCNPSPSPAYDGPELQHADTPLQSTSLKSLPDDTKTPTPPPSKPLSTADPEQPHPPPSRNPSHPTSFIPPSHPSNPLTRRPSRPWGPPDYESDGPHGGQNAARWRSRYARLFDPFVAHLSIPERTAKFDALVAEDSDTWSNVFAVYYHNHPEQIPDREPCAEVRRHERDMGASRGEVEGRQRGVFAGAWLDVHEEEGVVVEERPSPFSLPRTNVYESVGPKNELVPGVGVEDHSCAYCIQQATAAAAAATAVSTVKKDGKWKHRLRIVLRFVNLRTKGKHREPEMASHVGVSEEEGDAVIANGSNSSAGSGASEADSTCFSASRGTGSTEPSSGGSRGEGDEELGRKEDSGMQLGHKGTTGDGSAVAVVA